MGMGILSREHLTCQSQLRPHPECEDPRREDQTPDPASQASQRQKRGGNEAAARAACPLSLLQLTGFMPKEGKRKHFI